VGKVQQRGYTLIPLRVYFNERGFAKVELGLARGKRQVDRRAEIARREAEREIARALRGRR
jgi:SsrA-binding protein